MTRIAAITAAACLALAGVAQAASDWVRHNEPRLGYSVEIPGPVSTPPPEDFDAPNPYTTYSLVGTGPGTAEYLVRVSVYEEPLDPADLTYIAEGFAENPGDVILSQSLGTVDGHPSADLQVRGADGWVGLDRLVIRDNVLIQVVSGAMGGLPEGAERMRDSLRVADVGVTRRSSGGRIALRHPDRPRS